MSSLVEIRAAIVARLESVEGIGRVHDYERYAENMKKLKDLYLVPAVPADPEADPPVLAQKAYLQGFFVRRISTSVSAPALNSKTVRHRWRIRGYRALDDDGSSELAFDAVLEDIRAAFAADVTLGGVVDTTHVGPEAGLQLEESAPLIFADVLCHGARFSLITEHCE